MRQQLSGQRRVALFPRQLAQQIEELPAGAGLIEVVGIVFVVLIVLELVGVTDVFKAF